jgi:hypothetical protein
MIDITTTDTLTDRPLDEERIREAMKAAIATKGKYKGHLKRQCPKSGTDAAIFWQAAMMICNPHKVSIGQCCFMDQEQHCFMKDCELFVEFHLHSDVRKALDLDRLQLTNMGVW